MLIPRGLQFLKIAEIRQGDTAKGFLGMCWQNFKAAKIPSMMICTICVNAWKHTVWALWKTANWFPGFKCRPKGKFSFTDWILCFARQFFPLAVTKKELELLEGSYMLTYGIGPLFNFNFINYLQYSVEEDFAEIAGLGWKSWGFIIFFVFLTSAIGTHLWQASTEFQVSAPFHAFFPVFFRQWDDYSLKPHILPWHDSLHICIRNSWNTCLKILQRKTCFQIITSKIQTRVSLFCKSCVHYLCHRYSEFLFVFTSEGFFVLLVQLRYSNLLQCAVLVHSFANVIMKPIFSL